METTRPQGTDLIVSRACLGAMTFGAQTDATAARRMLDLCLDSGINFIHTANVYSAGESERILDDLLAGRRNPVVLASKASRAGRSTISVSLNWLMHHTPADCTILGASRMEQLQESLSVLAGGPLDERMLASCDELWATLRGVAPMYNR